MFAMLQSLCPAELTVTDRNKQNTDIHDPDLCQRVQRRGWYTKSNPSESCNNFSVAMTRMNLTVTWTRLRMIRK